MSETTENSVHSHAQLVCVNGEAVRRPSEAWLLNNARRVSEETGGEGRADAAGSIEGGDADVSPEKLLDDVRRTMAADPASARSAALRLVTFLSAAPAGRATIVRGGLAPWQLRKIDRYLRENLTHTLRLPALAEQINLSVSHFNRSFKVSRGMTPHQYIVKLRLELAQSLMMTTDDSLCGIALTCGLADQAHLTKLFRRYVGETPAAWRRQRVDEEGQRATANHAARGAGRASRESVSYQMAMR